MPTHNKKILCILLSLIVSTSTTQACTTWGAAGKVVCGKGLIIAKNRDNPPTGLETLKFNGSNYKNLASYITLSYKNNTDRKTDYPFISAGINQYGLVVVNNAAATTLEKGNRNREVGESALMKKLLSQFHTVSQVLSSRNQLFKNAQVNHLLIGDRKMLALVEIGHHHLFTIQQVTENHPYLFHTNTYESKELTQYNTIQYKDSQIRYKRIKTLLRQAHQPLTVNDFWRISYDRDAGANNSIFRDSTEATWIVQEPLKAPPVLHVRFTNPNQPYAAYNLKLDKSFWQLGQKMKDTIFIKRNYKTMKEWID